MAGRVNAVRQEANLVIEIIRKIDVMEPSDGEGRPGVGSTLQGLIGGGGG
jgi:hypothetical protein